MTPRQNAEYGHEDEEQDLYKQQQTETALEKRGHRIDSVPGEVHAGGGQDAHAGEAQPLLASRHPALEILGLHDHVDVKDGPDQNRRGQQVDDPQDQPQNPVKRRRKRYGLVEDPFRDGIIVSVTDIGDPRRFQGTPVRPAVAEGTGFPRLGRVLWGGDPPRGRSENQYASQNDRLLLQCIRSPGATIVQPVAEWCKPIPAK
jgi:hypothetical protein